MLNKGTKCYIVITEVEHIPHALGYLLILDLPSGSGNEASVGQSIYRRTC